MEEDCENYSHRIIHSFNPLNWKNAAAKIVNQHPESVVFCYWHPFFAPALLRIQHHVKNQNPEIKTAVLAHNVLPHERFPFGKLLSRKLLSAADDVIVLSEQSLNEARKLNITKRIHKLFHPVYEQEYPEANRDALRSKMGFKPSDKVFLFFGLVRHYKGLDLMIEAMNQLDLKSLNIRPFIVGEFYVEKDEILDKIKPEHREYYRIVDRFINDDEVAEVFTLSDAMILPYRTASQSGILANAINFRLPPIVSNLPGLTEYLENRKNALIVEKENIGELQLAIKTLTDSDLLNHLSENLTALKQRLSWEQFCEQFVEIIQNKKR